MLFVMTNTAQTQATIDKIQPIAIDVRETYFDFFKSGKYKQAGTNPKPQLAPKVVPIKFETPLPPLKLAKHGQQ